MDGISSRSDDRSGVGFGAFECRFRCIDYGRGRFTGDGKACRGGYEPDTCGRWRSGRGRGVYGDSPRDFDPGRRIVLLCGRCVELCDGCCGLGFADPAVYESPIRASVVPCGGWLPCSGNGGDLYAFTRDIGGSGEWPARVGRIASGGLAGGRRTSGASAQARGWDFGP